MPVALCRWAIIGALVMSTDMNGALQIVVYYYYYYYYYY